ncbi:MAG: DUF421 domain-containing protein [Clostridiales bacterium]|jgi:uncharacterized membrane protein YcaP (DUF421 family)|nr:DUF421 domain-containing protein [Clostridiales bacterium]
MLNVLFRTFIVYIAVLFIVRVMGKGELSKLDPFQIVILFMMAELAALPIETPEISIIAGLTALLSLLLLQVIFSLLSLKSRTFKNLVNGKASIIIEKGRVNIHEMKRLRMTLDELSQQLRLKNYPSINDIDYAIIEANGDMSIIPNPNKSPASREDLNISYKEKKMPLILIGDGMLYLDNMNYLNISEKTLKKFMLKQGLKDYSQIFICFSDEDGKLHILPKSEAKKFNKKQGWEIE